MKELIFQMKSMLISHMNQKCNKLKNIAIIRIKKSVYRICFLFMSKREAKKLMVNSNLTDKKGIL